MMRLRTVDVGTIILFFLAPVYSLPIVINKARKCDKVGIIALCLFFSLLAFLIAPNDDATNHGHWAYEVFNSGFFWEYNRNNNDLYLPIIEYVVLSLGLQYHYVIFITVLFAALPFWYMYYCVASEETQNNRNKVFVVFLLLFPFIHVMCGLRYFTAVSWLLFCNYLLLYRRNFKGAVIPLVIVSMCHFTLIVQIIILLLSYITNAKLNKTATLIIVIMLCSLSVYIVNKFMPYLYAYFPSDKVDMYGDPEYKDVLESQNMNFYISYWIKYFTWLPLAIIALCLFYHKMMKYKMFSSVWCFLILWAIGSGFTTLEFRWGKIAAMFFFLCYFVESIKNGELSLKFYRIFICLHSVRYFLEFYDMKRYIMISNHLGYLLYMPYPLLLCFPYDYKVYDYIWQYYLVH